LLGLGILVGGPGAPVAAQKAKIDKKAPSGKGKKTEPKAEKAEAQVVNDILVPDVGGAEQVAFINQQLEKGWAGNKLEPAERCSDYEFIRRASLDLIGRIAKVSEIQKFLADPPAKRRSLLIERLLDSEEFPNHFANVWTNMLLTRSGGKLYHNQLHLWLCDQFEEK